MLLGLPYGVNDIHYGLTLDSTTQSSGFLQQDFTLKCTIIAGKLIDRNIMPKKPSFAEAVALDEQLETVAALMPKEWWDLPAGFPSSPMELNQVRHRLLQQLYFFHIRAYLHLPFIVKSPAAPPHTHSTQVSLEASRHMLSRYFLLRSEVGGCRLFDCKTTDFVGFMGAVILFICICNDNSSSRRMDDLRVIQTMRTTFVNEEQERQCPIASSCHKTLSILLEMHDGKSQISDTPEKIQIPYFGTMTRKRKLKSTNPNAVLGPTETTSVNATHVTQPDSGITANFLVSNHSTIGPAAYFGSSMEQGGFAMPDIAFDDMLWEVDDISNFFPESLYPWLDTNMLDVDLGTATSVGINHGFPSI
jgi:hypothetical protein